MLATLSAQYHRPGGHIFHHPFFITPRLSQLQLEVSRSIQHSGQSQFWLLSSHEVGHTLS